jgi:hypothetical protein
VNTGEPTFPSLLAAEQRVLGIQAKLHRWASQLSVAVTRAHRRPPARRRLRDQTGRTAWAERVGIPTG